MHETIRRAGASILMVALLPLATGCASAREYRLPSTDPIPPARVLSVTMTDGGTIDFDDPGAVWLGSEKLRGYVAGEPLIITLVDVARLRLRDTPSDRAEFESWIWLGALAGFMLLGSTIVCLSTEDWC